MNNCGNCKWFSPFETPGDLPLGSCRCPLPDSIEDDYIREMCCANEGTQCPCHQPRETGHEG